MFDIRKFKSNITLIIGLIVFVILLSCLNIFITDSGNSITGLDDGEINVNQLVINEVMTSNKGAYVDETGKAYDWIELYNGSNKDIDLSGYTLSDEESGNAKWIFPSVTIKSKEHLIVYLSGSTSNGLYANFALAKKGGELLTLKKPNGKVVDTVRTESLTKNTVMSRNSKGEWIITSDITPGYDNNEEGRKNYLENLVSTEDEDVIINEFLTNNNGNFIVDGEFYGYIEIKNAGESKINLSEYCLSDDINAPFSWNLPDVDLKAGEVYLFYTSELNDKNNTNFTPNKKTGTIILTHKNKIVEQVNYENVTGGYAYIKANGKFMEGTGISPGYDNDADGIKAFNSKERKNPNDLIISEVMSSNNKYLAQNGGNYYDWIELYNNSDKTINLSDYTITTDEDNKNLYQFENKSLKPGEYYIVMASGNTSFSNSKYKHTNFKISPTESLYLYKNNEIVDSTLISNIPVGYSYGRSSSNGYYYFSTPTPGKANSGAVVDIAYAPILETKPGIYNDIDKLTVEINGSGTIYYTLDGSEPTKNSKVYSSPLILSKTTVIKAVSYENGKQKSETVTGSYIINENHTMAVLSISMPSSSFKAVLNAGGSSLTLPTHVELFEEDGSFSIDCGIKLFGGSTRFISKKSFALKFSSKYGPSNLEYKVFDNRDATNYKSLVLRSGSQDSAYSMMRDELATGVMDDYGTVDVQAYKPVILYVNAEYWGIYFIREKVDEDFIQNHYDVDGTKSNIIRIDSEVKYGSSSFYYKLLNYVSSHDMSVKSNYEYVKTLLDVENFADYWAGELYTTNNDIVNQRYFNNTQLNGGRIKAIFYDFDWAFYNYTYDYLSWMLNPAGMGSYHYNNVILRGLMKNKEFKQLFLERLSYNYNNVWTNEKVMKKYNELYKILEPEMARNQKRWGGAIKGWNESCADLKKYIQKRRSYLLDSIQNYYG